MPRSSSPPGRRLAAVLFVALVALAAGGTQALAGGGSATAPIQYHNGNCGIDNGQRFIGTATFTLKGTTLTVRVKVHGADPGTYHLSLFTPTCGPAGLVGTKDKFKVDSSGDGEGSASFDVTGLGRSFFVDVGITPFSGSNDSLIVNL